MRKILRLYSLNLTLLLLLLVVSVLHSQTRSRIIGTVTDGQTGEPLFGANVIVKTTYLGAATDLEGKFFMVNVPVGTYEVQASLIGYKKHLMKGVIVSADRVTSLNFVLQPTSIESEEVVVTAQADVLHKEVTNTQLVATSDDITSAAGIREINSFLENMPGVEEDNGYLTIRGGTSDQVGAMVNGLAYNNAAVGNAETTIPLSAVDQVSLLSGGYGAEYGNFRSGLINITTKTGSKSSYHGTISVSADQSHLRRFGQKLSDPNNDILISFLNPEISFVGTEEVWADNEYMRTQHPRFIGWNQAAENYNRSVTTEEEKVTPLDMYLLGAWMFMAEPDFEALEKLGYTVSDEHKRLIKEHAREEEGSDFDIDAGFGGPVPFVGKYLGDMTFYLANKSTEQNYIMPVSRERNKTYTTLLNIKSTPMSTMSVTVNGLWKRQLGVSPIRPAWGDMPSADDRGGLMKADNIKWFSNSNDKMYYFDPAFFPQLDQTILMGGVTINQVLSNSTFYELTLSALDISNHSLTGDSRDTTEITRFGPIPVDESPYNKLQYAGTHRVSGYRYPSYDSFIGLSDFRFRGKEGDLYDNSRTTQYRVKFDIASQINEHHYLKGGFEYNYIDIDHKLWEKWNNNAYNAYEFNYHRTPSQTGAYIQDQISYEGLVANLGLRLDYYYGGGGLWPSGDPFSEAFYPDALASSDPEALYDYLESGESYVWDRWEEYDKENPGFLKPVKNYLTLSPRIGLSFPVTDRSKFYFNYGHFRSNPPYYSMYLFRYRYTKNGVYDMSNPNLEPPRTVSYELGAAYNFYKSYMIKVSGYYKDVTGQHGEVAYQSADGSIDYDFWSNNEYEDIQGVEVNLSKSDNSWITGWINFNYMLKKNGLTGREVISDVTINSDQEGLYAGQEDRFLPTPQLNASLTLRSPDDFGPELFGESLLGDWSCTFFFKWKTGKYLTWNPLGDLHVSNNLQYPDYYMLDLKLSKTFKIAGLNTTFFVDVSNLLNLKVSLLYKEYGYSDDDDIDMGNYLASLRLPMYDSPDYDELREQNEGYYLPGNDKVGDMRSSSKPYINDPDYSFLLYGEPRDIWFGLRIDF